MITGHCFSEGKSLKLLVLVGLLSMGGRRPTLSHFKQTWQQKSSSFWCDCIVPGRCNCNVGLWVDPYQYAQNFGSLNQKTAARSTTAAWHCNAQEHLINKINFNFITRCSAQNYSVSFENVRKCALQKPTEINPARSCVALTTVKWGVYCTFLLSSRIYFLWSSLPPTFCSIFHSCIQLIKKKKLATLLGSRHSPHSLTDNWMFPVQHFIGVLLRLKGELHKLFFSPTFLRPLLSQHLEHTWHNQ